MTTKSSVEIGGGVAMIVVGIIFSLFLTFAITDIITDLSLVVVGMLIFQKGRKDSKAAKLPKKIKEKQKETEEEKNSSKERKRPSNLTEQQRRQRRL